MYCSTISLVSITITFDCKITTQKPTLTLMKMSFRCFDFQNVFVAEIFSVQCVTSNDRCCNRPVHFPDLVSWPSSLGFDCPYMDVHLFLCSCWYLRFKEGHRKRRKKIPHTGILLVIFTKRLESICPLLLPFTTFGRRRRCSTSSNTEQRSSRWEITDGLKRFWQRRSKGGGKEEDYILIAALFSIWLPSVVGDQSRRIYLVRGMTSLVSRVLLLAIVVGLAAFGLQHHIYQRPFLLFCFEEESPLLTESGIVQCSFSKGDCFTNKNVTQMNQMRYEDALTKVYNEVLAYHEVFWEIGKDTQFTPNQLYNASAILGEILCRQRQN